MARYRVKERSFINNRVVEAGTIIEFKGKAGKNLEPVEDADEKAEAKAKAAREKAEAEAAEKAKAEAEAKAKESEPKKAS